MIDITVIILTKDERLHIRRCLERLKPLEARRIVVVDSMSTDGTQGIAREMGAEVVEHPWPGNQAAQFNWALDNLGIQTEWVLRLDADEYLTNELIAEMSEFCGVSHPEVGAILFPLGRAFLGKILHHGIVNGIAMIRMFRFGAARYENRLMDEHLNVIDGLTVTFHNKFIDDSQISLSKFITKHINYADREAAMLLSSEIQSSQSTPEVAGELATEVAKKRKQKNRYSRMPLFWRGFGYFLYRYIIKLGFLDGKEGFLWDFLQGWWYRTLVDAKILEIKRKSGGDSQEMKRILREEYGIDF